MTQHNNMIKKQPLGIVQSRGLGDIVIALPIAHHYHQQGHEIHWPICSEFISSMKNSAAWVNWIPIETDREGRFFVEEPLRQLAARGISQDQTLWLYQYINSHPEKTDVDLFAMMKFDQYKYAAAGVPFGRKWTLDQCIVRDHTREQALKDQLVKKERYWVIQQQASDLNYVIDTGGIDEDCQIIEISPVTDSIWDWLKILEDCEGMILIDSVFANIVDQMNLNPQSDNYYLRKWNRHVDGNPVFLNEWTYLPVEMPKNHTFKQITASDIAHAQEKSRAHK